MSAVTLLIVVLVVLLLAGGPYTGWHGYGYWPSGVIGIVIVVILLLVLMGRL